MPIDQDENEDPSRVPPTMQGSKVSDSKDVKNSTIESINSNGGNFGSCDAVIAIAIDNMSDTVVSRASIAANDSGIENEAASCVPRRRKRPQPPKIEIPSFVKELCFCERKRPGKGNQRISVDNIFGSSSNQVSEDAGARNVVQVAMHISPEINAAFYNNISIGLDLLRTNYDLNEEAGEPSLLRQTERGYVLEIFRELQAL
ncbi:hypothetical protein Scep_016815 [Stephania cephalantha]|uniref:Uncharacterized protein n=1 Tax=Stephania cephalantha TaxID=152367 RepID=A0AAP0INJ5_9MAGN